ncbi:hypothetical protein GTU71_10180 [Rathayibacter sp. VKM Ac-2762]|uniref:hypothetical protein n=1 Tax=Rathayibacter sp. VKM Ac-2762 TaxID=2609254 RepID=UPI00132F333C|nr:hypothetical protein [Rathayibacter sp. VKM Ac-2762]QHF21161.1 hypothetical protein GTU71_10180 [Rathayibacter sp. VKM Ac-2762]
MAHELGTGRDDANENQSPDKRWTLRSWWTVVALSCAAVACPLIAAALGEPALDWVTPVGTLLIFAAIILGGWLANKARPRG